MIKITSHRRFPFDAACEDLPELLYIQDSMDRAFLVLHGKMIIPKHYLLELEWRIGGKNGHRRVYIIYMNGENGVSAKGT
jgi:hypothetical protein